MWLLTHRQELEETLHNWSQVPVASIGQFKEATKNLVCPNNAYLETTPTQAPLFSHLALTLGFSLVESIMELSGAGLLGVWFPHGQCPRHGKETEGSTRVLSAKANICHLS